MQLTRQLLASKSLRAALIFATALAWCVSLLTFRTLWTWNLDYAFLIWNLALAMVPLVLTFAFLHIENRTARALTLFLWLIFLPNAPYIMTDFIHLRDFTTGPIWLDIILLFSCAATGLAVAFYSNCQIHEFLRRRNQPRIGWAIVIASAFLSGFAIYLGRFLRWRSIDIFNRPLGLASDVFIRALHPLHHPRAWGVTLAFGLLFVIAYSLLRISILPRPEKLKC
jgi:uncharacterized membrane protein